MFFFFNQKTEYEMRISDWSSDVCSSDLKAEGILFLRHSLRQRPGADRRQPYRRKPRPAVSEQGVLPALALIGGGGRMAHDGFGRGMDTGPVGRAAIERARAPQAFQLPHVELDRIDPAGPIHKAPQQPAPPPPRHQIAPTHSTTCWERVLPNLLLS